jgi:hypothetical protein
MTHKLCPKCQLRKPLALFSPDKRTRTGVQSKCKPCQAQVAAQYRKDKPNLYNAAIKKNYIVNYDNILLAQKRYRAKNKDKVAEWKRTDRLNNRSRIAANNAYRRAATIQRTVAWANIDAIKRIYDEAQQISMLVGEWYHVDHIIPLIGKNVCGLHLETNLQIISATENLQKGVCYVSK